MNAAELIAAEVREEIRKRGIDPRTEPVPTRELVVQAVHDYDERTLAGSLPLLADVEQTCREIFDQVSGFGPLQQYLDDPEVEEIWLNSP